MLNSAEQDYNKRSFDTSNEEKNEGENQSRDGAVSNRQQNETTHPIHFEKKPINVAKKMVEHYSYDQIPGNECIGHREHVMKWKRIGGMRTSSEERIELRNSLLRDDFSVKEKMIRTTTGQWSDDIPENSTSSIAPPRTLSSSQMEDIGQRTAQFLGIECERCHSQTFAASWASASPMHQTIESKKLLSSPQRCKTNDMRREICSSGLYTIDWMPPNGNRASLNTMNNLLLDIGDSCWQNIISFLSVQDIISNIPDQQKHVPSH